MSTLLLIELFLDVYVLCIITSILCVFHIKILLSHTHTHAHTTFLRHSWILSGITRVSRHPIRKVKPIWIYWSKR